MFRLYIVLWSKRINIGFTDLPNMVVSNHFHSVNFFLFSSTKPYDFYGMLGTGLPVSMYTTKTPIDKCCFNITWLKEFFTLTVKDRYQLNYFICIKDFNAQTITSLKLNLFYYFIYCCQHHERKMTCLDMFLLLDRQWGTEYQYLLSRFLDVSILQLLIFYRIYDYDMLTLSQ
jgi:branched-subunit amino acid transport protein AzlD